MKNFKSKIGSFILVLDTGGWLFLRPIVLISLVAESILSRRKFKISKAISFNFFLTIILISPSIISGLNHDVNLITGFAFFAPIILLFPIYTILSNSKIEYKHLESGGVIFAWFIVIIFIGYMIGLPIFRKFLVFLSTEDSAGFFGLSRSFLGYPIPAIYFKATLLLVPIGLGLYHSRNWKGLFIVFMALIISYSKFGVFVLTIFIFKHLISKKKLSGVIPVITLTTLVLIFISSIASFSALALGFATRFLHVSSIYQTLIQNPIEIIVGQGAGSEFYTSAIVGDAVGGLVTDSEVSQFEAIRRYGIVFNLFMTIYFYKTYRNLKKMTNQSHLSEGLLSYYLVSFSNPILLTLPAMIYYATLLRRIYKNKQEQLSLQHFIDIK